MFNMIGVWLGKLLRRLLDKVWSHSADFCSFHSGLVWDEKPRNHTECCHVRVLQSGKKIAIDYNPTIRRSWGEGRKEQSFLFPFLLPLPSHLPLHLKSLMLRFHWLTNQYWPFSRCLCVCYCFGVHDSEVSIVCNVSQRVKHHCQKSSTFHGRTNVLNDFVNCKKYPWQLFNLLFAWLWSAHEIPFSQKVLLPSTKGLEHAKSHPNKQMSNVSIHWDLSSFIWLVYNSPRKFFEQNQSEVTGISVELVPVVSLSCLIPVSLFCIP